MPHSLLKKKAKRIKLSGRKFCIEFVKGAAVAQGPNNILICSALNGRTREGERDDDPGEGEGEGEREREKVEVGARRGRDGEKERKRGQSWAVSREREEHREKGREREEGGGRWAEVGGRAKRGKKWRVF